jgi:hypothetical protein
MAESNSFLPSVNGDRQYGASDFADYFATLVGDGVFALPDGALKVTANTGMTVNVAIGKAFIQGYRYYNTAVKTLTVSAANASNPRIDRVVIRLDLNARSIYAMVITGTPAASPVAPGITRSMSTGYYDLCIAQIAVPAAATAIASGNITDTRADDSLCGSVKTMYTLAVNDNGAVLYSQTQALTTAQSAIARANLGLRSLACLHMQTGSAWISITAGQTTASLTITYDDGFSAAPLYAAVGLAGTGIPGAYGGKYASLHATSPTATQITLAVQIGTAQSGDVSILVRWVAIGYHS